ncbi:MAG: urease accessory protein UreD [Rhizobacter sp.]|nr:urease accessory protein UreD [Rhizobacter sp.]
MGWHGHLKLNYRRSTAHKTVVHDEHNGPLRILQSLYPEGQGICHNVLVHPPGGVVGGDVLQISATLGESSHALITTPGATRFYRSAGEPALQALTAQVAGEARLEWLPLETILYRNTLAENRMRFELAPGAEMIGWDVLALGLPASDERFDAGRYTQQIELPGVWLERGTIDGGDTRLLQSPLAWAGHSVLATMWFATGQALVPARRDQLLEAAREAAEAHPLKATAGCTAPHAEVVVLRVLAHRVEPAMGLLTEVWKRWRALAWGLTATPPRVWRT